MGITSSWYSYHSEFYAYLKKSSVLVVYLEEIIFSATINIEKKSRLDRWKTKSRECRQFCLSKKIFHFKKRLITQICVKVRGLFLSKNCFDV